MAGDPDHLRLVKDMQSMIPSVSSEELAVGLPQIAEQGTGLRTVDLLSHKGRGQHCRGHGEVVILIEQICFLKAVCLALLVLRPLLERLQLAILSARVLACLKHHALGHILSLSIYPTH